MRSGDYWKMIRNAEILAKCEMEVPKLKIVSSAKGPRPYMESVAFNGKRKDGIAGRPRPKLCEVCGLEGTICFDHCHVTEKFRGWICNKCNTALGMVNDNPEVLRALAAYLEKSRQ